MNEVNNNEYNQNKNQENQFANQPNNQFNNQYNNQQQYQYNEQQSNFNNQEESKHIDKKDKEEIDAYFKDVKRKGFPIKFFLFLLILLMFGGIAYYYFVIDSPHNILLMTIKNTFTGIKLDNTEYKTINYNYELDINLLTNNKEYVDITNIINNFYLTGNLGIDKNKKETFLKLNTFYEQKPLLTIDGYHQNDEYVYIKLNNLFDKVIKTKIETEEDSTNEIDNETLEKTIQSTVDIMIDTLKKAEFKKEYTKLNDTIAKKITFTIDEKLTKELYKNMLNNKEFMENYSKIQGMTESELKDSINEDINNIEDFTETTELYVTPLENEFLMIDITEDEDRTVITKEKDEYNYKIYTDSIIEYQGTISVEKEDNSYEIMFTSENIEEEMSFEINLDLSYEYNTNIDSLDITNALDSEELTEEDGTKIAEKLIENDAFVKLVEDFTSITELFTPQLYFQTT